MRLGRPLAAASAVAAMTGASLIASPVLANSSNSNSSSTPSSTAEATTPPGSPAQPSPTPGKTGETTPAPGKTSAGSSFKITQEKTFASSSTNTSFTISGTGCTGKQATVGIALYAPDGSVSDVVKTEAAEDGSWTSDLDLAALIKSIGTTTATTTDGWTIGAGCMTYGADLLRRHAYLRLLRGLRPYGEPVSDLHLPRPGLLRQREGHGPPQEQERLQRQLHPW